MCQSTRPGRDHRRSETVWRGGCHVRRFGRVRHGPCGQLRASARPQRRTCRGVGRSDDARSGRAPLDGRRCRAGGTRRAEGSGSTGRGGAPGGDCRARRVGHGASSRSRRSLRRQLRPRVSTSERSIAAGARFSEHDAKELLRSWGFPVVEGIIAQSGSSAVAAADHLGYPVAVKVNSPDIAHKTEIGGVRIGVADGSAAWDAYESVIAAARSKAPGAEVNGALIERMATGIEMIVGVVSDPTFGPMLLVGLGGTAAEAFDDVQMSPAPSSPERVRAMVESLRGRRLLTEPRGGNPQTSMRSLNSRLVSARVWRPKTRSNRSSSTRSCGPVQPGSLSTPRSPFCQPHSDNGLP